MEIGKSFFLWQHWKLGTPEEIGLKAKMVGLNSVMLKICDGVLTFGENLSDKSDTAEAVRLEKLGHVVDVLHREGFDVIGWQYVYGYDPVKEANIAVKVANALGVDGFIVNGEREYKVVSDKDLRATQYMDIITPGMRVPIGLSSYRFPKYHMAFPWKPFLTQSDFIVPQVYWLKAYNPGQQLVECMQNYDNLCSAYNIPRIPIYPAGCAYTDYADWKPTPGQLVEFANTAKEIGCGGISFWEWNASVGLGLDTTIANIKWGETDKDLLLRIDQLEQVVMTLKGSLEEKDKALEKSIQRLDAVILANQEKINSWIESY